MIPSPSPAKSVWSGRAGSSTPAAQTDAGHAAPAPGGASRGSRPCRRSCAPGSTPCRLAPTRPDPTPLLRHLVAVGLATEERTGPDDDNPDLTCHELVRERIRAWMHDHPQDRADLTENTIRLAYAERLEAVFDALQHQNMTTALQAGSRALVYCVQAGAYDRLGGFASSVVTSTSDPRLLAGLLPHLEAAAEAAPEGEPRWSCLCYLADALDACRPP